ncbi:DUF2927 domain-containing protein [Paracoccus litorisediminis]|uniref:DUF2927 domain-containing protein n=1 Tax=Paracoccus litorisediminis TaxID=2006130 RepID=UPI001FEA58C2|nr:DUF2927 domain-containing protein [Paracoccus litorisediminis]
MASRTALACMAVAFLSSCVETPPAPPPEPPISAEAPKRRPDRPVADQAALREARAQKARATNVAASVAADSPASRNMRDYLKGVEETLLSRGLLRTDDGSDIQLTPERLTDDFVLIALYDEYTRDGERLISRATPAPLRRWAQPVRLRIEFGDSVSSAQRARDRSDISSYAARLQAATGHSVSLGADTGNVTVLILNEDERRAIGPRLAALVPGIPDSDVAALSNLAPQNYCTVFAYSRGDMTTYDQAVVLIRSETPPRLRRSCIHEEVAQGLGLANDSRLVRPSLFNDDEEFAYLTHHDELLLKILYDPRLRPGMTEAEARPIVLEIARKLLATST